eukprot:6185469-Pleurochrysis_carterae.AAC.3
MTVATDTVNSFTDHRHALCSVVGQLNFTTHYSNTVARWWSNTPSHYITYKLLIIITIDLTLYASFA